MKAKFRLSDINWAVIFPVVALMATSVLVIYRIHGLEQAASQVKWMAFSAVAFLLFVSIDYRLITRYALFIYGLSILSLVLVLFTPPINGAHSWFLFGGMSLQPSEFAKVALIVLLAAYLPFRDFYKSMPGLVPPLLLTLLPFSLVIVQPDLGTALIFLPVFVVVMLVAGVKVKHMLYLLLITLLLSPLMYMMLEEHQKKRIHAFINPGMYKKSVNLHLEQARIAIGAGGLTGYDPLEEDTEPHLVFLRYASTDYVFAVIGEQFGFLGTVAVLLLYALLFYALYLMLVSVRDPFGRMLVAGAFAAIAAQMLIHTGGNLDLIPFTGVPLPFVSAGGSSLMAFSIMIALVINVGMRRKLVFGKDKSVADDKKAAATP
ncbi:MAG: FtsW/RodA/SpoVE family cell cycle protein [Planctomycetota bacterium]|nr:FtsW/RodA/SpoVE family cell cycle protein [Planctomycetota bacterium]